VKTETKTIIKYRLERAAESLSDAEKLLESGSLHSTVNRIYYAMFYSVTALLLTKNLSSSKHSGIRALFNREFINKGEANKDLGRFYSEIFEKRQKSDYKDFIEFPKKEVEEWFATAVDFIKDIRELTLNIIDKDEPIN